MHTSFTDSLEGPYLKVGQISGPGGLGLQVGSGRLRPLDTPPALTLTADVQREVLEVLTDWQGPSLSRLEVGPPETDLLKLFNIFAYKSNNANFSIAFLPFTADFAVNRNSSDNITAYSL